MNEKKIKNENNRKSDRRYRDHIVIFHGFLYALVFKTIVTDLIENCFKYHSSPYYLFLYLSLSWDLFLLLFLLESWWGVLRDRDSLKIRFLSLCLPLLHPALLLLTHLFLNKQLLDVFPKNEFVMYSSIYPLIITDFIIIVFLIRKNCYDRYTIIKPSNKFRLYSGLCLIFICLIFSLLYQKKILPDNWLTNDIYPTLWTIFHLLVALIGMLLIALFLFLHRDLAFSLSIQSDRDKFFYEIHKQIFLTFRILKTKNFDLSQSDKGFGYIVFSMGVENMDSYKGLPNLLRGHDTIHAVTEKRFFSKKISIITVFPILNNQNDILKIKKRLFEKKIISNLIESGYITYHDVEKNILKTSSKVTKNNVKTYIEGAIYPISNFELKNIT